MARYNSKTSTVASVVNLVRWQAYRTERPPLFAARLPRDAARRARVRHRQLMLVLYNIILSRAS